MKNIYMNQAESLQHIRSFLLQRNQMTVATFGDHPWIATVFYSIDKDLNIYFLSDPQTLHCRQIAQNPSVSVAVSDSPQNPAAKKKGIQAYGKAEEVSGMHKIKHAIGLWRKTLGVTSEDYTYEGMLKNAIEGRMYKIQLKKIKFFNQELWEEGDEPTISLTASNI